MTLDICSSTPLIYRDTRSSQSDTVASDGTITMTSTLSTSLATSTTVGWIGLGSMGTGMASRIQKHLTEQNAQALKVYNRTGSRCEPLEKIGAIKSTSVEQLCRESTIIFISVSHHDD